MKGGKMNTWVEIIAGAIFVTVFLLSVMYFFFNNFDAIVGVIFLIIILMAGILFVQYAVQSGGAITVVKDFADYGLMHTLIGILLLGSALGIVLCEKKIIGAVSWIIMLTPILIFFVFLNEAQIGRHIGEEMNFWGYIKETIFFYVACYVFLVPTIILCSMHSQAEEGIKSILSGGMTNILFIFILYVLMIFRESDVIEASSLPGLNAFRKIPQWFEKLMNMNLY